MVFWGLFLLGFPYFGKLPRLCVECCGREADAHSKLLGIRNCKVDCVVVPRCCINVAAQSTPLAKELTLEPYNQQSRAWACFKRRCFGSSWLGFRRATQIMRLEHLPTVNFTVNVRPYINNIWWALEQGQGSVPIRQLANCHSPCVSPSSLLQCVDFSNLLVPSRG